MKEDKKLSLLLVRFSFIAGLVIAVLLFLTGCVTYVQRPSVAAQDEYSSGDVEFLATYGQWINVEPYGQVWQPNVVQDWQPYYYGNWVWTGNDWAWASYEPFGWLVYHYGSWDYRPDIGWYWIRGNDWSPARVQWITYGDYVGWTPLPPPRVIRPRPWETGQVNIWNVVEVRNFTQENVGRYKVINLPQRDAGAQRSFSNHFPQVKSVENYTKQRVPPVKIQQQPVKMQNTQFRKMVLPPAEAKKVDKYKSQVEREVLKPQSNPAQGKEVEKKKNQTATERLFKNKVVQDTTKAKQDAEKKDSDSKPE